MIISAREATKLYRRHELYESIKWFANNGFYSLYSKSLYSFTYMGFEEELKSLGYKLEKIIGEYNMVDMKISWGE